ncbi:MAG: 4Fe-4S ferredoxin [Candidatus Schekmanbacteria bacterium RIFCSPHIGHO2_02_FULL_38_11]|uniref:4Fe-4S ferredoxin n=1 Tax=Candidatus Schekmanbacteria bacterium RIFCSPLOWO2_12_FULL_38_15 TaxID=1817883 RepID=A0A1F7SG16_9BACT|nr:MAG: 4Fe-4S ferredoxin [Candidatus Schekmanbacteria bacterium GWA2_38_9]OGL49462.1 MAG: 4Fe-4S ferredoxin [Candidatus Schekmanbacteria bacterium RIFCSPLOWO2_02_FULL_38_14]OGL52174.1 MAG: 4Fe-4S ferredoxin [Candidatus Schekmanbacteria bacterium RIFCSPLOWO2_12_FULL_38_15]OGL53572.1 MAG: 4Fe-4S ferredoxin [Candidatus Schekmanbacteria bacterium RIFCSPHIGHO2_02_FULL_38_11]
MKAMLVDTTLCIGCMACVEACKKINKLPQGDEYRLSSKTYTTIKEVNGIFVRKLCMHCSNPSCASVCPVGALHKTEAGPVVYDEEKCIGCRYCMVACPFSIPKYEWENPLPRIRKCIFCAEKVARGEQTACTDACPTGATEFGERDYLLNEAKSRIRGEPKKYVNHIYGEEEVGGTSVIFLASAPFSSLGFRTDLAKHPMPMLTWNVLSMIPDIVIMGGVVMGGIWWITNRRNEVRVQEALEREKRLKEKNKGN